MKKWKPPTIILTDRPEAVSSPRVFALVSVCEVAKNHFMNEILVTFVRVLI